MVNSPSQTPVKTPLKTLVDYLSGEFENQQQAAADSTWYVHLRLWHRLVPALSNGQTYTFFLEQASVVAGKPPYRQRILQLSAPNLSTSEGTAGVLRGEYFALADPLKFRGAGTEATLLEGLSADELISLPNSETRIEYQPTPSGNGYQFKAALPEGKLCSFEYDGQQRYVYLGFDIAPEGDDITLLTYDKGIDPDTGRGLWGALMGPFQMIKQQAF